MAPYKLEIKTAVRKNLVDLRLSIATHIAEVIEILADKLDPAKFRKLKGFDDRDRIRVGDDRVV